MKLENTFIKIKDNQHGVDFLSHLYYMGVPVVWGYDVDRRIVDRPIDECSIIIDEDLHMYMTNRDLSRSGNKEIIFDDGIVKYKIKDDINDFSKAEVSDRVYSVIDGWGSIIRIMMNPIDTHPIFVKFDKGNNTRFTVEGKRYESDELATLFWDIPTIIAPEKPVRFKTINGIKYPSSVEYHDRRPGDVVISLAFSTNPLVSDVEIIVQTDIKELYDLGMVFRTSEDADKLKAILRDLIGN